MAKIRPAIRDAGYITSTELSVHYNISKWRMAGIIVHPDNNFPAPKHVSSDGRIKMYDLNEVEKWLDGRELKSLPYLVRRLFPQTGSFKEKLNKAKSADFIGVGGHAVGGHLRLTVDFYKLIGNNGRDIRVNC